MPEIKEQSLQMFKKAFQQGRSEVRGAKNNERHVCGRARVGERPVSPHDARTKLEDFFNILLS